MVPLQHAAVGALAIGLAFLLLVRADERSRAEETPRLGTGTVPDAGCARTEQRREE